MIGNRERFLFNPTTLAVIFLILLTVGYTFIKTQASAYDNSHVATAKTDTEAQGYNLTSEERNMLAKATIVAEYFHYNFANYPLLFGVTVWFALYGAIAAISYLVGVVYYPFIVAFRCGCKRSAHDLSEKDTRV